MHVSVYSQLGTTQIYYFTPTADTLIQCAQGSTLGIKKNSFIDGFGNPLEIDSLRLEVIEVTDKADMVIQNVHTTGVNGMLSTGGMIYFEVFAGDKSIAIKDSSEIDISMQTNLYPGMPKLYDIDTNGNWSETKSIVDVTPCKNGYPEFIYNYKKVSKKEYVNYLKTETDWGYMRGGQKRRYLRNQKNYLIPDQLLDTIYHCPDAEYSNYNFKIGRPGWYNLDSERKLKMNQTIMVKSDIEGLRCHIVIRKDNSSVTGMPVDGGYYFPNLPKDFACYLVAYKVLPDGNIQYLIKSMMTDSDTIYINNLKITDAETFRKKLEIVNQ